VEEKTNANRPVVVFVAAVHVGPALEKDGGDREGGELADGIAAHAGGVAVDGQVERTVAVLTTRLELQESVKIWKDFSEAGLHRNCTERHGVPPDNEDLWLELNSLTD